MIPNCSAVSKGITKLAKTWMCDFKGGTRQRSKTGPIGRNRTANIPTTAFQSIYGLFVSISVFIERNKMANTPTTAFQSIYAWSPCFDLLEVHSVFASNQHVIDTEFSGRLSLSGFSFCTLVSSASCPFGKSPVTRTFNNFKRLTDAITESSNVLL